MGVGAPLRGYGVALRGWGGRGGGRGGRGGGGGGGESGFRIRRGWGGEVGANGGDGIWGINIWVGGSVVGVMNMDSGGWRISGSWWRWFS